MSRSLGNRFGGLDLHVRKEFPTGHRCSAIDFSRLAGVRNGEAGDNINTGVVFEVHRINLAA